MDANESWCGCAVTFLEKSGDKCPNCGDSWDKLLGDFEMDAQGNPLTKLNDHFNKQPQSQSADAQGETARDFCEVCRKYVKWTNANGVCSPCDRHDHIGHTVEECPLLHPAPSQPQTAESDGLEVAKEKWLRDNNYSCFTDASEETFDAGWQASRQSLLAQKPEETVSDEQVARIIWSLDEKRFSDHIDALAELQQYRQLFTDAEKGMR